jgi:hypothetical protein
LTENRPEGVKSENYVKNKEYIEKMMKNRIKRKEKTVLPLGFDLTIICLKTFHAQCQRGGKFEIHEIF